MVSTIDTRIVDLVPRYFSAEVEQWSLGDLRTKVAGLFARNTSGDVCDMAHEFSKTGFQCDNADNALFCPHAEHARRLLRHAVTLLRELFVIDPSEAKELCSVIDAAGQDLNRIDDACQFLGDQWRGEEYPDTFREWSLMILDRKGLDTTDKRMALPVIAEVVHKHQIIDADLLAEVQRRAIEGLDILIHKEESA